MKNSQEGTPDSPVAAWLYRFLAPWPETNCLIFLSCNTSYNTHFIRFHRDNAMRTPAASRMGVCSASFLLKCQQVTRCTLLHVFFLLGLGGVQMSLCVFPHSFSTYCLKQALSGPEAHWFSQAVCPASSKDPLDSLPSWCWDYRRIPQQSGFYRGSERSNPGHHMWCNSFIHRATTASTARSNLSYCYIWGVGFLFIDFVLN